MSQVANATGEVVLLPDLNGVQGVAFERPTVVLAQVRRIGALTDSLVPWKDTWSVQGCS